jgi:signal transduction histidine kinase
MSTKVLKNIVPADNREPATVMDRGPLGRRLRPALLLSFGGLLALLLYSGANALHTLRELHEAEESARTRSLERRRVLSTVVLTASTYSNNMEAVLMNLKPEEDADPAGDVAKCADQARRALQAYPADRNTEEQALIEQLQTYVADEDSVFRSAHDWKPQERRSRGQAVVIAEIIPRRQQFVAMAQKIELLNDQQMVAARQASFAEFGRLQDRLTKFLILALTSGLLLAVGSAVYIMRLERQSRLRYSELVQNRGELQQLSARLVDAQETERRAISRELHDEVGQALGLLLMDAGRLSNQLGSADEKGQELVRNIKTVAERTVQTVRNMALLLRPSMLDDLGLVAAVEWYARELSRRGEIEVGVQAKNVSDALPDPVKVCVYRLVQEAVNNVQRHAKAKKAVVDLEQAGDVVRVKITDDGAGFDPERARGMGLLGMEERVKRLGGKIEIDSRPGTGTGTTIRAEIPLARTKA